MTESLEQRVNRYLQDTISAERNFEDALATFGKSGTQPEVQQLLSSFSAKAKTQHERLTALLEKRGGTPSTSKTVLAETLAFSPLSAQLGHSPEEKNTQHLMITFAAAAAEMAMYESLSAAAEAAGDTDVVTLARQLQKEEHDDYTQVWSLLGQSAAESFRAVSADGGAEKVIQTYLEDAIAAEKTFESQLEGFAKESDDTTVTSLYTQHAQETHSQYDRLTARLEALGGSPSVLKSFMAHVFGFAPKVAQIGHDTLDRQTQNLMMAYAVENAEVAMYESLAMAAKLAGDTETHALALSIQAEEKATAEKVWAQIAPAATQSMTLAA